MRVDAHLNNLYKVIMSSFETIVLINQCRKYEPEKKKKKRKKKKKDGYSSDYKYFLFKLAKSLGRPVRIIITNR